MKIEILSCQGCPNHRPTLERVREVLAQEGIPAIIEDVLVLDQSEAERLGFLGSPSVRVNGIDIEPEARERTNFTLGCRLYGEAGIPPRELVAAAVRNAH